MVSGALNQRQMRAVLGLLGVIAVCLVLLVAGLAFGGLWLSRSMTRLTGRSPLSAPGAEQQASKVSVDASELANRQDAVARELEQVVAQTQKDLADLEQRRKALSDTAGGPLKKLDTTIRMNQLLSDELAVLLKNLSGVESSIAHAARPLPAERRLARPAQRQARTPSP
jgi:hypothetical protein